MLGAERLGDKVPEERMGVIGPGFEFRMKLARDEPGVVFDLDYLHEIPFWVDACKDKAFALHKIPVFIVKLVSMPMAFVYILLFIGFVTFCPFAQPAGIFA